MMTRNSNRRISRLRQQIDGFWERALLRGNLALLGLLIVGASLIVFIGAAVLAATSLDVKAEGEGFFHALWEILLRAISPDQLTDQDSWPARIFLLIVTLLGLLMFSTLVSISNSSLSQRLEQVRRGRKPINLENHFVILNWNEFGYRVLREIAEANRTAEYPHRVALLCDQDPLDLMKTITMDFRNHSDSEGGDSKWFRHPNKWIVIRRGSGHHTADLRALAAIDLAAGVIVLHEEESDDSQTVRCVLAISATLRNNTTETDIAQRDLPVVTFNSGSPLAHSLDYRLSTIAQSFQAENYRHINYIPLSPDEVRIGIETQVARHRGLSAVYQDLLDFGGEEIYILDPPHGMSSFGEAFERLTDSIPLGIMTSQGIDMWPDWDKRVMDDPIVVLAHDRKTASQRRAKAAEMFIGTRGVGRPPLAESESFLFIGWNSSANELIESLPTVIAKGSTLKVLLRKSSDEPQKMTFGDQQIEILHRTDVDPLDDPSYLDGINHVVVFADMSVPAQQSDAQVLTDLLACRHYADHITNPDRRFTIVGELRRRSSRHIAGLRLADDLLVSESLMAAAATQLVFEPRLEGVISALLSRQNPVEIISLPLHTLGQKGPISWRELQLHLANRTGEITLGLRTSKDGEPSVILNPDHSTILNHHDEVIILSKSLGRK